MSTWVEAAKRHNNNNEPPIIVHRATPKTEDQKAFEASVKKWHQYYKDNQGKIPAEFPKTIFDGVNEKPITNTNVNEVKRLSKLLRKDD